MEKARTHIQLMINLKVDVVVQATYEGQMFVRCLTAVFCQWKSNWWVNMRHQQDGTNAVSNIGSNHMCTALYMIPMHRRSTALLYSFFCRKHPLMEEDDVSWKVSSLTDCTSSWLWVLVSDVKMSIRVCFCVLSTGLSIIQLCIRYPRSQFDGQLAVTRDSLSYQCFRSTHTDSS